MKTTTLADLAAVANGAHVCGQEAVRKGLAYFRTAGEALIEAQREVGHGGWMKWMKENLCFGYRQAARYMLIARRWDGTFDSETNVRDALDALANGVPDAQVAELLGHSGTAMLHRHYAHLTARAQALRHALGRVCPATGG